MKHTFITCIVFAIVVKPLLSMSVNHSFPVDSVIKAKIEQWIDTHGGLSFLENKGQMTDMEGRPVKSLLFKASAGGVEMYVTTSGLSYVFTHKELIRHKKTGGQGELQDSIAGQYCRADMELVGAHIQKENVVKEDESGNYSNYYLGNCPDGILNVHSYQRITIKNIYPGIDWVLYTTSGKEKLQYDFIVHPGADPSLIKLRYKWADKPELQNDGSLKINIPLGNIVEGPPVSLEDYNPVHTAYTMQNGEVRFALANYDKSKTLVIDPAVNWELNWGTYYGGSGTDVGNSIYSNGTDVWVTGSTTSTNFPTHNPGGLTYYQGTLAGAAGNIFILCFTTAGVPVWTTYYGGTTAGENDVGEGITGDANNVWVFAQTTGSATFPLTNAIGSDWFQNASGLITQSTALATDGGNVNPNATAAGPQTPAILVFNLAGVRQYATYIGGVTNNGEDYARAISDDGSGHVFMTGSSTSLDFPVLYKPGAYQQANTVNAPFIVEYSAASPYNLLWSTCIGTNQGVAGSVSCDGTNVYTCGVYFGTSGGLPYKNPGGAYYQTSVAQIAGGYTGWIGEFNVSTNANVWCTLFGGNGANYPASGLADSRADWPQAIYSNGTNTWVTGYTTSTNLATMAPAAVVNPGGGAYYISTNSGKEDVVITEFTNATDAVKWGTYYGGSNNDDGLGINEDANNNVWVTGSTISTDFPTLDLVCSYNQSSLAGVQNAFVLQFNTAGVRQWATYFGGNGTDEGNSIMSDGNNVWLTGGTSSTNFPLMTLAGAYNQAANAGGEDAFVSDFEPKQPLSATMGVPTEVLCNGGNNGSVTVTVAGGITPYTYLWNPNGGSNATATSLTAGSYTVTITDNNGCTASSTVTITQPLAMAVAVAISGNISCNGGNNGSATANVSNGTAPYIYSWAPAGGTNATVTGLSAGNYTVTVTDNNGCTQTASINITQPAPITGSIASTDESCYGYNDATATVTPGGGTPPYNYLWNPTGQMGATAVGLSAGSYTVIITDATECTGSATVTITQPMQMAVGFSSNIFQGCEPLCIQFRNETAGNGVSYVWTFGDGDTSHAESPIHCYSTGGNYGVTLTAISDSGCSATLSKPNMIKVYTSPTAAFSFSPQPASVISPTIYFTNQSTDQYGIIEWWWTFGDQTDSLSNQQNPVHTYQDTGNYCARLIVMNMHGCTDSTTNCLEIEPLFTLYIPSAFTPNGDGLNDVFMAKGTYIKSFEMYIFDRWGMELFHSNDINNGWNGTVEGHSTICQEDTYVYKIFVLDYANNGHNYIGNVTLLK